MIFEVPPNPNNSMIPWSSLQMNGETRFPFCQGKTWRKVSFKGRNSLTVFQRMSGTRDVSLSVKTNYFCNPWVKKKQHWIYLFSISFNGAQLVSGIFLDHLQCCVIWILVFQMYFQGASGCQKGWKQWLYMYYLWIWCLHLFYSVNFLCSLPYHSDREPVVPTVSFWCSGGFFPL